MSDREHATPERHQQRERAATLTVGPANDVAERDADERADEALAWLAGQQPVDRGGAPEPHAHTAACAIGRVHAPTRGGTIGLEGGAVDQDTDEQIRAARGGGEALSQPVRRSMEAAFGADLGKVRVHRGPQADKLSRSISAEAFTTGNDIFFAGGAYAPETAKGQKVLAHEVAHVMQERGGGSVRRLSNPFRKKTPAEVQMALEKKQQKEALAKKRNEHKQTDKQVRGKAKQVNAKHKSVTENIKLSYKTAPGSKMVKPGELVVLEEEFRKTLAAEKQVREKTRSQLQKTGATPSEIDRQVDEAGAQVWENASEAVRSLRPLRFDDFDKALNEVRELAEEGRGELVGQSSAHLEENERMLGVPMTGEKAEKKVLQQRDLERRTQRGLDSKGQGKDEFTKKIGEKADTKVSTSGASGGGLQEKQIRADTDRKKKEEKFARNDDLDDAQSGLGLTGTVAGTVGKLDKGVTKGVVGAGLSQENVGTLGSELAGQSALGLGQLFSLISDVLKSIGQIREIRQGTADKGAQLQATEQVVGTAITAGELTRSTLLAVKEGVQHFGGGVTSSAFSSASEALPIVGLITSTLGLIENTVGVLPTLDRHWQGLAAVDKAVLADKAPLAASYDRVNSRNAQLIEQRFFNLAKDATMLGLHIAEVASAGGFGIPAAAKLTITITSLAHKLGHVIYDTVSESKSAVAKEGFGVKKKEGASRDVLKYDIGSSVDVIIVAAKKHKDPYARRTLVEYGVRESEIDGMWLEELREKVLDGLDATGNPRTVKQKITDVKDTIAEKLGSEKGPVGVQKEEKSTFQTVKDGLAKIPKKVSGAIAGVKEAHQDAKNLVKAKNTTKYDGKSDRGAGSTLFYMLRGGDKNEKSFAGARRIAHDNGTALDDLPRSENDRKKRAEMKTERDLVQQRSMTGDDKISKPVALDQGWVEKISKMSNAELIQHFSGLSAPKPEDATALAQWRFIELEAQHRLAQGDPKAKQKDKL